jgi:hypothetical protein
MAYPTVSGPYGFLTVQNLAGRVFNQATIDVPILPSYASNIGYGDLVAIDLTGSLIRVDLAVGSHSTFAIPPIGVFLGCQYTDPILGYALWSQSWQASNGATDAIAKICNDPDVILKAAVSDGTGAIVTAAGASLANVGQNIGYFQAAGGPVVGSLINTITRDAVSSLDQATIANTPTLPFRIYQPVTQTRLPDGTFCELLVTYNWNQHFYRQGTGI